jgi:hypothetical protein
MGKIRRAEPIWGSGYPAVRPGWRPGDGPAPSSYEQRRSHKIPTKRRATFERTREGRRM